MDMGIGIKNLNPTKIQPLAILIRKCDFFLLIFINFAYHVVVLCYYKYLSLQPLVPHSNHLPLELGLKGFESMNLIFSN